MRYREADSNDAQAIAALVQAGFESFRAWASPSWRPPAEPIGDLDAIRERLSLPEVFAAVAEEGSELYGVVAFRPLLAQRQWGEPVRGVAYLWLLFVHPDRWRRGIALSLHDLAVRTMRARGFRRAELRTPSGAEQARALYERCGWAPTGSLHGREIGLDLTTYELDVGGNLHPRGPRVP